MKTHYLLSALLSLLMLPQLLSAGTITSTPEFKMAPGKKPYLVMKKGATPIKLTIEVKKGTLTVASVTANPAANVKITQTTSGAKKVINTITLARPALGKKTEVTIKYSHKGDQGEDCVKDGNFTLTILNPWIEEVSLEGGAANEYFELTSDDEATVFSAPHWKDSNGDGKISGSSEHNYSAAFLAVTKPKIGGKIHVEDASLLGTVELAATGPDGVKIPNTTATVSATDIKITPVIADAALPTPTKLYLKTETDDNKVFKLKWKLKVGADEWELGETKHTIYQCLAVPQTPGRQETLFHTACTATVGLAPGAGNAAITDKVWAAFTPLTLKRVDGKKLTYYKPWTTKVTDYKELIKSTNGQCGSWARFFLNARMVHGLKEASNYVLVEHPVADGFLVETWKFAGAGTSGKPNYPYKNITQHIYIGASTYKWAGTPEVTYFAGTKGQNQDKPASLFGNHQFAHVNNTYYDPSYGKIYATINDMHVSGLFIVRSEFLNENTYGVDLNGNKTKTDPVAKARVIYSQKAPTPHGLVEDITTYTP